MHAPHDDPVEAFGKVRALDPEMVDAVWTRWRHWFLLHPPMNTRSDVVAAEALAADDPTDRGKRGWKWSLFTDRNGIPVG